MAGTFSTKRNRQGSGHGKKRHKHASGSGLVRYYFGLYQQELRRKNRPKPQMFASIQEAFRALSEGKISPLRWAF